MNSRAILQAVVWMVCMGGIAGVAPAQSYPTKSIRFVVPFPPGGGADTIARIVGQSVSDRLGEQIVVDNRAGAGGNIAAEIASKANPDGYTLLQGNVAHTISASLYRKLNYDFIKDFAAVTELASTPFLLLANPSVPGGSVRELIALAKAKPDQLNYGSSGTGGPSHLAAELLKSMAGIEVRHVPYKGASPAANDLIAGRIQMMFFTIAAGLPHVKAGRLKALAIASAKRTPLAPEIPTVAESGVPGYEAGTWYGVLVPAGTSGQVVVKLHEAFAAALNVPHVRKRLTGLGFEVVGSTPQQFAGYIESEIKKWARVVKASGAVAE